MNEFSFCLYFICCDVFPYISASTSGTEQAAENTTEEEAVSILVVKSVNIELSLLWIPILMEFLFETKVWQCNSI